MKNVLVALCGSPGSGKRTILDGLAFHAHAPPRLNSNFGVYGEQSINIIYGQYHVLIRRFQGIPEDVMRKSFDAADVMIYVLKADKTNSNVSPLAYADRVIFKQYLDYASTVNKTHRHIPWILVLNKCDIYASSTILQQLPHAIQVNTIHCTAHEGKGISDIWHRLTQVLEDV